MSRIQLVRDPVEIRRAGDDLPTRVLYLTFEELWVFQQFLEQSKMVFDGSMRYAVAEDNKALANQLELKPGEIEEHVLRDIVERLEVAKIIERVGKTGKGKTVAYKLTYNPEDIVVVEINSRPNLTVPEQYMNIVKAMLAGEGPNPNLISGEWVHAFTSWVRTVGYHDDNIKTLMYKIRGYTPKVLTDRRSLSNRWGIWYLDVSGQWLLAFEQFLPLTLKVIDMPPSRRFRKKKCKPMVDVSQEFAVPTSVNDPIAHIKSELDGLNVRNMAAEVALCNIKELERQLKLARAEHDRLALSLDDEQRLADLVTTLRVLESIS